MADGSTSVENRNGDLGLTAFVLKLLAALTMLVDHVGAYLLTDIMALRVIGRLAFPIYAYFIAEGCRYTRNKRNRFCLVFGMAMLCEAAYVLSSGKVTGTSLVTFSCSILMIYALQAFKRSLVQKRAWRVVGGVLLFIGSVGVTCLVGHFVPMDYGIVGAFLPVLLAALDYVPGETPEWFRHVDDRFVRLAVFALGLLLVCFVRWSYSGAIQLYSLVALVPLAFYNGKPGPRGFKYGFYIFYPAHLLVIWGIGLFMNG